MSVLETGWGGEGARPGRFGIFFIAIWTLFLLQPLDAAWDRRAHPAGWIGTIAVIAFTAWYIYVFAVRRLEMRAGYVRKELAPAALKIAVGVVLAVVICMCVGQAGTACAVYLSVMCAMMLPGLVAVPAALVNAGVFFFLGTVVPHWKTDYGLLLSTLAATLAVWGIQQMLVRNTQLVAATEENQRLAVSAERNRFARDLHDILGHSLTVITVKAELANRLIDVDVERARAEIADLERLSRDALGDVRRAVEGYRELTLPGELARARTALEAAAIDSDLPNATEDVPGDRRELFAWTIREGVTNVIRHSRARTCRVRLSPTEVEVRDDGHGPAEGTVGHGLVGLRERAAALGATVVTEALHPGFSLRVVVPE